MEIKSPEYKKTQVISNNIAELLIEQLSRELFNHNLYATFGNYFNIQGLYDLKEYYYERAKEELEHSQWISKYLNECVIPFAYPKIEAIEVEIVDNLFPFQKTVDQEIETTMWINKIVDATLVEKDYQTFYWLRKLVEEQTEEESLSLKVLQMAKEPGEDWSSKGDDILDYYKDHK